MFRIFLQILSIALLVSLVTYVFFGDRLQKVLIDEACERQVQYVCNALESQTVSLDLVCNTPLPEISAFKYYYQQIQRKDGDWYRKHGWSYFPSIKCRGEEVKVLFMDKTFICNGKEIIRSRD